MSLNKKSILSLAALAAVLASCSSSKDIAVFIKSNGVDFSSANSRIKIEPVTNDNINPGNEKITVDVGQGVKTGASISFFLNFAPGESFQAKANKDGHAAFTASAVKSIKAWLVELPTGSSPVSSGSNITPVAGSVFSYNNTTTTPQITFTNVPQNGTGPQKSYYVAVSAYKDNIAGSFFGLPNQPLAANITNTTTASNWVMINGTTPAIISDGGGDASLALTARAGSIIVGNPPNYTVSSTTGLILNLRLQDETGASIETSVTAQAGTAGIPSINMGLLSGIIQTIAGGATSGTSGNGGQASSALLDGPNTVVTDASNNIYIAESFNCTIRKISASTGNISVVAGQLGSCGSGGNNGPAAAAQLNEPRGLAIDSSNNIYVADAGNSVIRKFSVGGSITTVAGTFGVQCSGAPCGDGGAATSATLGFPEQIAVDSGGNIYIVDTLQGVIRKVTPGGAPQINRIAGTYVNGNGADGLLATSTNLFFPTGVALDSTGTVYISDSGNNIVRKISSGNTLTRVAGNATHSSGSSGDGGQAAVASLSTLGGIYFDNKDNLFIADQLNQKIRKVNGKTGIINIYAGKTASGYNGDNIAATDAQLKNPVGVFADSLGNVFIADFGNNRIRRVQ
jgi:sugar lactone lactonase YvrE